MKVYRRNSIFRIKLFRRIRYGRGFGVHSPLAFQMVRSIIRPLSKYYAEEQVKMTKEEQLLFRLIARHNPSVLCLVNHQGINIETLRQAKSDLKITSEINHCDDSTLLCTDQVDIAKELNRRTKSTILLTGIRKSRNSERAFKSFVHQVKEGLIIDLFHSAIFVYLPDVVYLYRSTY